VRLGTKAAALGAVATALAIPGCGGDDTDTDAGADPAQVVPADAPLYAEAIVRPEGEQREEVEAALGQLLDTDDPGGEILDALEDEIAQQGSDVSYTDDIEPWLGERAGAFFLNFEDASDGAVVAATTDEDAAREFIERVAEEESDDVRDAEYEGVEYVAADETAGGIVDGFAVIGSEAGFRAAVDASQDSPLSASGEYTSSIASVAEDGLVTLYAAPAGILEAVDQSGELQARERDLLADQLPDDPVAFSLGAGEDALSAEVAGTFDQGVGGRPSDLFDRIPDDAWIALAQADLGASIGSAAATLPDQAQDVLGTVGIDLDRVSEFAGDFAGYFAGTSPLGVEGGVIVEVVDEVAAEEFLGTLSAVLSRDPEVTVAPLDGDDKGFELSPRGVPITFPFTLADGFLTAGLTGGDDALRSPEDPLVDSDSFSSAAEALESDFEPTLYFDFDQMLEFFGSIPDVTSDADFQAARPYMERMDFVVAGVGADGDRSVVRIVLGLATDEDA
jgi:Protein of unknown function (DUF3352)